MPRKRKAGREFHAAPKRMTHEQAVALLVKDRLGTFRWGAEHPALAAFEPKERRAILSQVQAEQQRLRDAKRLPVLRERLRTWPASQWGTIFCERPNLEKELTQEQRKAWLEWLRSREA